MKHKLLTTMFVMACIATSSYAQTRQVSGKVSGPDGAPISGASVSVVGTTTATQTDQNGNFTINAASGATLNVSFIGYTAQRVSIGNSSVVTVVLQSDESTLEEVVVTGYGKLAKKEFTGASARVGGDVVAERPLQSFTQGLTGQATGVNIVQPNGLLNNPPVVRVRGLSSISLSSFPLVIIDGIAVPTGDVSENSVANNPLADLNPEDIESIDVLKDAASASIYGSRAAAGVLVIKTKRGKAGAAKLTYDGWVGISNAVRLPELMNAAQYISHKNQAIATARELNPGLSTASYPVNGGFFESKDADGNVVDTKWQDYVYKQGVSHNHNINVSGGSERTNYFLSGFMSDQDGILVNNNFKRKGGRVNLDHKVTDWFKFVSTLNFTNSLNKGPNSGSVSGSAFNTSGLARIANVQAPNVSPYNADGSYNLNGSAIGKGANVLAPNYPNPLPIIDLDKNSSETNRFFATVGGEFKLLEGLTLNSNVSWDLRNTENIQFWNPENGDGYGYNGYAYNNHAKGNNWSITNVLNYEKSIDNNNFSFLIGNEAQNTRTENWGAVRYDLTDWFYNQFQGNYLTNDAGGNSINEIAFESYFGSFNYNYSKRYFASVNFRRDGNSALSSKNRWGNFGGASVGWTISEESFFKNGNLANVFSNARLRASWGRVGNGNLNNYYGAYNIYGSTIYGESGGLLFNQAGNEELKWETSNQTNIGLDLGLVDNKLTAEINWYNKNIDNMILEVPQSPSKGIPDNVILANVGSMYNRGWEFGLNYLAVKNSNFTWNTNLNFSTNKNMVTALAGDEPILGITSDLEISSITEVGKSAAQIYAVRTDGVNPENGRRIFINKDGERVQFQHSAPTGTSAYTYLDGTAAASTAADAVAVGNSLPTWFGGFNNSFKYKNFDAQLNFTFSGGNYIYNGTKAGLRDQRIWNNSVDMLDAWTPTNKSSDIPRAIYGDNISNGSSYAIEANVEKGDFLRLQTASIGYKLPNVFGKSGVNNVRLYASVNNAFLITKYTGVDPEISSNGNSNVASGVERNSMPNGRTFTFGVNVGF